MIEIIGGFGVTCIIILQGANYWQGRRLMAKIDQMVCETTCTERRNRDQTSCEERRANCATALRTEIAHNKREMRIIERKMDHHSHNGSGVKYIPVDTTG